MTNKTSKPAEKKTPKFYSHLSVEEKRKLRKQLESVVENKKNQLKIFEDNFIKPIKHQIALVEKVKKSEISLQHYIQSNEKWSKWLMEFMSNVSKGMQDEQTKDNGKS